MEEKIMEYKILTMGVLLFISLFSIRLSKKVQVPLLIMFLFIGILAGSEGIGGIYFDDAELTQHFGKFCSFIYFVFKCSGDKEKWCPFSSLSQWNTSYIGSAFNNFICSPFAFFLTDFTPKEALLFGAIVSSTDAAAVVSVLGDSNLKKKS